MASARRRRGGRACRGSDAVERVCGTQPPSQSSQRHVGASADRPREMKRRLSGRRSTSAPPRRQRAPRSAADGGNDMDGAARQGPAAGHWWRPGTCERDQQARGGASDAEIAVCRTTGLGRSLRRTSRRCASGRRDDGAGRDLARRRQCKPVTRPLAQRMPTSRPQEISRKPLAPPPARRRDCPTATPGTPPPGQQIQRAACRQGSRRCRQEGRFVGVEAKKISASERCVAFGRPRHADGRRTDQRGGGSGFEAARLGQHRGAAFGLARRRKAAGGSPVTDLSGPIMAQAGGAGSAP